MGFAKFGHHEGEGEWSDPPKFFVTHRHEYTPPSERPTPVPKAPMQTDSIAARMSEIEELTGHRPSSAVRGILESARDALKSDEAKEIDRLRVAADLQCKAFDLARKEAQTAKARGATTGGLGQLGRKTNNS